MERAQHMNIIHTLLSAKHLVSQGAALLSLALLLVACATGEKAAGTTGGPCYPNNTCQAGLTCYSGLCVKVPDAEPCPACKDGGPCPDGQPCPACKDSGPCSDGQPCPACKDAAPCPACKDGGPCPDGQPCPACKDSGPCPDANCPQCKDSAPPLPDLTPDSPGKPVKIVFITSKFHHGNFGGVLGADVFCQSCAKAAGLYGTFKAWLSGANYSSSPAARFTKSTIPYALTNGKIIAKNWADLTNGNIAFPINVDEYGKANGGGQFVYSYTLIDGTPGLFGKKTSVCYGTNCHCNDWTTSSNSTPNGSAVARKTHTNDDWTDYSFSNFCGNTNFSLYCFQQ